MGCVRVLAHGHEHEGGSHCGHEPAHHGRGGSDGSDGASCHSTNIGRLRMQKGLLMLMLMRMRMRMRMRMERLVRHLMMRVLLLLV
jgi:hypothetical protein